MSKKPSRRTGATLARLYHSGSTSRVLNLLRVWQGAEAAGRELEPPMFKNRFLNRAFILKHRLRGAEAGIRGLDGFSATKLIIPFDCENLALGGKAIFVGQDGWVETLASELGDDVRGGGDLKVLDVLDRIPSFDPFLMREWLAQWGVKADADYFRLSQAEIDRMEAFVVSELRPLVTLSGRGVAEEGGIVALVRKLMGDSYGAELEPLRATLKLSEPAFRESVFCWKGLLYYKWMLSILEPQLKAAMTDLAALVPAQRPVQELAIEIDAARRRLLETMAGAFNDCVGTVEAFDARYLAFVRNNSASAFLDFLARAPELFLRLGEEVGQIGHIVEFWRFRKRSMDARRLTGEEIADTFHDLEFGLSPRA